MMSSELIRDQADANDVSPSGKLMLKYGPGWTIRGGTNGDRRGSAQWRKRELHDGWGRKGDEIVTGSINESSGEIVKGREYRCSKLDRELKGWVMKGSRLDEWLESKCERVCWAFVPHYWSRIKFYLSFTDHPWVVRPLLEDTSKCIGLFLWIYEIYKIVRNRKLFKIQALTLKFNVLHEGYPCFKPCLSDKTDSSRVDEFSPQDKILINMRQNGCTTTKRGIVGEGFKDCRMRRVTEGERERRYARW